MQEFKSVERRADGSQRYRILTCVYSWYYFRQLRPVIEKLAKDGHTIFVVSMVHDRDDFQASIEEVCARWPNVSFQVGPERGEEWAEKCSVLRQTQCLIQSRAPRFDQACRTADEGRLRRRYPALLDKPFFHTPFGRELAWRVLRRLGDALPTDPQIDAVFADFSPDVMVITPLIDRIGAMWDYMASAHKAGVRTVFPVHSWDNLSSKSRLNSFPDLTLVWNETQVEEARRFHGLGRKSIRVTGAQAFDDWFAMQPTLAREDLCSRLNFDPNKPIFLYVCSAILKRHMSKTIETSKTELPFFRRWIEAVRRSSDERLRNANVIIRPHPKRERQWDNVDLSQWGSVVVYPEKGGLPDSREAKEVFYDSMYHCDAVVGINTSAMIESAIVGRPVLTILDPDYAGGQVDMQHFQYLLEVGGGLLVTSKDYEDHTRELARLLDYPDEYRSRALAFVQNFVRPLGEDAAGTPIFANAIVQTAALGRRRKRTRRLLDGVLERKLKAWEPKERLDTKRIDPDLSPERRRRKELRFQARRAARAQARASK